MHIPIISHIPAYLPIPYSHTAHKLQKIQPQIKQDQRFRPRKPGTRGSLQIPCADCRRGAACPDGAPIPPRPAAGPPRSTHPTGLIIFPAPARPVHSNAHPASYSNSLRRRGGHGHGVASRCDDGIDRGAGMSWSGLWPGSPGNRGRPDAAKTRRRGAGSRRTDGRSRRPPARPGAMLETGFAVSTSLLSQVFLKVFRWFLSGCRSSFSGLLSVCCRPLSAFR